ncbi:MAG: TfoX/Sxy family protein [Saprospiraceae bacterium]|nr:TfoX/Sxy family protein [Saprospiraceae bacterium]
MAYNELLADRIRVALAAHSDLEEKKMFGGLAFMYKGKMACGIVKDELMVRVVASRYESSLEKPHCREMDFTGKALKGFLYIAPEGFETDKQLAEWVGLGIEFVDQAPEKKSKKK